MITLIGIGPGAPGGLTAEAREAINQADLLIGAARMLDAVSAPGARTAAVYRPEDILSLLDEARPKTPCVLYSGDPGFWSGAQALIRRLEERGLAYRVLPGLSSVQTFAARLGRPWKDWVLASAHGQSADLLSHLREGRPVFLLTGGDTGPAALCKTLADAGLPRLTVTVGENLSYPDETITVGTVSDLADRTFSPLNVVLVDPPPVPARRAPGLPDEAFIRGQVPMSKQEVRAVILAKLAVMPSDVCWDVGAGTGSVSVEMAMQGKEVWAVEYDPEACALIRQNREKFHVWNLTLEKGRAPEALARLPKPDKVFIGGSEGALRPILQKAVGQNPNLRICVSAITLETAHESLEEMSAFGLEPEVTQLSVSRTRPAGGKHLLLAQNPIFLITGGRP